MNLELNYGRGKLSVRLPDWLQVTVIRKPTMPVIDDPAAAVRLALEEPVDALPLSQLAKQASSAAIAICDITRPVPNHLFLRPLIETLLRHGIAREKIVVLVATGLHRPNLGVELEELVGDPWVLQNVRIENHYARNDDDHVLLGKTPARRTVVRIDRRFVEADLRIVTGLVEPHFMAGYSGGRKVIAPGLAHAETITTFHNGRFMDNPGAANCNLQNNPLHEEQLEVVRMLGQVFALNTVVDESRALAFINFGNVLTSHRAAVSFMRQYAEVPVDRQFKTVVTSAAGYPLDRTYYQTVKGMIGPLDILETGGRLIIAAACSEGMGSKEFVEAQRHLKVLGSTKFRKSVLEKSHAAIDEWQTQMQLKPLAVGEVQLYTTGLSPEERELTGVTIVESVADAVLASVKTSDDPAVALIPEGPYVVPFFRTPEPQLSASRV